MSQYPGLPTGTVGAINELRVSVDLMARGYAVFRALSPSCPCDLAILKDDNLIRVEVKTGYRLCNGRPTISKVKILEHQSRGILALVVGPEIIYHVSPSYVDVCPDLTSKD